MADKENKDKDKLFHLRVIIHKGKNILGSDGAVCSPYLKLTWGNKKKYIKTKVVAKSQEPEWNQTCLFEIKRDKYPDKKPELEIELYEHNKFSGDKLLYATLVSISDNQNLILGEGSNYTLPVSYPISKGDCKGDITYNLLPIDFGRDKAEFEKQKQMEEQKKIAEVEKQFLLLVDQLATEPKAKEMMLKLPYQNKIQLIEQHKGKLNNEKSPDHFTLILVKELVGKKIVKTTSQKSLGGSVGQLGTSQTPGTPPPNVLVTGSQSPLAGSAATSTSGTPPIESTSPNSLSSSNLSKSPSMSSSQKEEPPLSNILKDLSVALRSRGMDWIREFFKKGGVSQIVELLQYFTKDAQFSPNDEQLNQQLEFLNCIKNLMNNAIGISFMLSIRESFKIISLCLGSSNERVNELAIALLSTICLYQPPAVPLKDTPKVQYIGHRDIIEYMNNYKNFRGEKRRFLTLVDALRSKPGILENKESLKTKSIYLSFINVIINSPSEIDLRLALRQEFYWLGIKDLIENLSKYSYDESPALDTQITVFEDEEEKDNKEMSERFVEYKGLNLNSVDDVLKALLDKIRTIGLIDTFREIVKDLLLLPIDDNHGLKTWVLASRIIKQISLNEKSIGVDGDEYIPLENLLLTCEQEAKELPLKAQIETLKKESQDLTKKISIQEIEIKEKNDLIKKNEEISQKLLEEKVEAIKKQDDEIKNLKEQIASMKANGVTASSGSNVTVETPTGGPPPPPPPPIGGGPPPPPPPPMMGGGPPPPPPPPMMGGGPPPPPPPFGKGGGPPPPPMFGAKKASAPPRKEIPLPGAKMKGLQWVSLNDKKIAGTVFSKFTIDTSKDINLDYKDIESQFAAKVVEKKESNAPKRSGPVTILDPKIGQNLSIFLSQFKGKSFDEICKAIIRGDETQFQGNHIQSLITFLPSDDDITNINEFLNQDKDNAQKLGPPEQFSMKIHSVPQVKQRLQAMKFKYAYDPKKADIKLDIENFKQGTKELASSDKIIKILEVVLILGNFINGGTPRGGAYGFKLNTITKLSDTKTTDNKQSLVNYLVRVLQKDFPQLADFAKDLSHVEAASKVSLPTLQSEVATLKKDFTQVQSSVESIQQTDDQDTFKVKFSEFVSNASVDIEHISQSADQIDAEFKALATLFGEDPKIDPTEFFQMFLKFIDHYDKAAKDNEASSLQAEKIAKREAAKKLKEEEDAKKKKLAEERKQKGEEAIPEAVVDDLLNTIASGDAFKNRRRAGPRQTKKVDVDLDSIEI